MYTTVHTVRKPTSVIYEVPNWYIVEFFSPNRLISARVSIGQTQES